MIGSAASTSLVCHHLKANLISLLVRGPEGEVVPEQLHDESGVLVRILCHVVQLCDGILKGSSSHLACFFRLAQDLVLEDGVVQGKTQTDRVGDSKVFLCNCCCVGVGLASILCCRSFLVTISELSDVAVVVGLHLLVEDL